jgi:probable HAF family extracellular repeat protein
MGMLASRLLAGVAATAALVVAQGPSPADAGSPVEVTYLHAPDGAPVDHVVAINDRGEVLGGVLPDSVLWRHGEVTAITDAGARLVAEDLSDRGHVAGWDFRITQASPFVWRAGRVTRLPTTAPSGAAFEVNDSGDALGRQGDSPGALSEVVGWVDGAVVTPPQGVQVNDLAGGTALNDANQAAVDVLVDGEVEAAIWDLDSGAITMLGTLGGPSSWATAINEAGDVTGLSQTASGEARAFLWREGRMIDLGTLGGSSSEPVALNDRGDVVGISDTGSGPREAFLWRNGRMVRLPSLGGTISDPVSRPTAINERGQVVGESTSPDGRQHAVLWQNGRIVDLDAQLDMPHGSRAVDIDDEGRVLGQIIGDPLNGGVIWST